MPKIVDPVQRRRELAEAVWRVIRREGLEGASVRNVAQEAGLSMGSLRNTFGTQAELLVFAMGLVVERIEGRMAAIPSTAGPREAVQRLLEELLPLDDERREENDVWMAFTARSLVDTDLYGCSAQAYDLLRGACARCVRRLAPAGADQELETDRLFALLDGLAVHMATRPDHATGERTRGVLSHHLDALAAGR